MSEEANWFYETNGERQGPVDAVELQGLYAAGKITDETLVWKEGMSDWAPLRSTDFADGDQAPSPPPVPPRERSASDARPASAAGAPPVPVGESGNMVLQPAASSDLMPKRDAVFREGFRVGIRSSLGRAWDLMKSDFWPFVGMFALMAILAGVASQLGVTVFFLMFPLMIGFHWYVLLRMRGEEASIDDIFVGFKRGFGALAMLNLIAVLLVVFALILASIPIIIAIAFAEFGGGNQDGLIAIVGVISFFVLIFFVAVSGVITMLGYFASLLVVDCDWPWKRALSTAWQACRGNWVKLALFYLVFNVLMLLGAVAFYVGTFVTGAWASMAINQLYEDAFGDANVAERS